MERVIYDRMHEQESEHWWFLARRKILNTVIDRHIHLPNEAAILEAGCGTGGNLNMLATKGSVSAFEPDETARDLARSSSGMRVEPGALPDQIPFANASYDMIAMFDVLEHVEDDLASLKALATRLKAPASRIILTVPALPFLWSNHDVMHHHFRRYTKTSLRSVINTAGLKVETIFYFNSLLLPPAIAARMVKKITRDTTPDEAMPPDLLNSILTSIMASERHFADRISLPAGLSLCAIISNRQHPPDNPSS